MQRAFLVGLLALALVTPGCVGSIQPAYIPQDALEAYDWEKMRETKGNVTGNVAQGVLYTYQGNASQGIAVLSTNDLPIVNETEFLPALLEEVEAQEDVGFNKTGYRVVELPRLNATMNATEYRVSGVPGGNASAILFTPPCDAFAAVLGWGLTETEQSQQAAATAYNETVEVASQVEC